MENTTTNNTAAVIAMLTIPSLDDKPEVVKTAYSKFKAAAEVERAANTAAEKLQADINAAIMASDINAAHKLLKGQAKITAELEKAKTAHKTAAAELEKAKEENPYKQPTAADYCIVAAADLLRTGAVLTAKSVATAAITLMPEGNRPSTPNGTEMTARGVIAVLNCIKVESK